MIGDVLAPTHLLLIMIVALLVLGPKRLPEVGRSLGKGLRDFREAMTSYHPSTLLGAEDEPPTTAATATPPVAAAAATAAPPQETTAGPAPAPHAVETAAVTEVLPPSPPVKVPAEAEPQDADVVEKPAG